MNKDDKNAHIITTTSTPSHTIALYCSSSHPLEQLTFFWPLYNNERGGGCTYGHVCVVVAASWFWLVLFLINVESCVSSKLDELELIAQSGCFALVGNNKWME